MPFDILSQPVKVLIDGHDSEGRLILADDQRSAVIVRLDCQTSIGAQGALAPGSRVRQLQRPGCTLFKAPDEAGAWVKTTLTRRIA